MKTESVIKLANHTPGPWSLDGYIVLSDHHNPQTVAVVSHDQQGLDRGRETSEANARLIAAAPQLLEACKLFVQYDEENCQTGLIEWAQLKDAMVAAIAAAEKEKV